MRRHYTVAARQYKLSLGTTTRIMGIVNITPDSFSHDGCWDKTPARTAAKAFHYAKKLLKDGADILDIGGESSRPGSKAISVREEIERIGPTLKKLTALSAPISVDTYKPAVAQYALDAGASIINNIKGLSPDTKLLKMIRDYNAAVIVMHMRGTPKTMQKKISFRDPVREIIKDLKRSVEKCLEIGIKSDRIIVDPGIGFGKTLEQNLEIIRRLPELRTLDCPILVGTSRKSFIGSVLDRPVEDRLMGTASTVCASILNGAHIVRVHDVKKMKDIVRMTDALLV